MNLLALGFPGGPGEWLLIAGIALLLFGKRLPEVGRSLGKGIVEFKRGLKGIEDEVESASEETRRLPNGPAATPHKFDPYTGKPVEGGSPAAPTTPPPGTR